MESVRILSLPHGQSDSGHAPAELGTSCNYSVLSLSFNEFKVGVPVEERRKKTDIQVLTHDIVNNKSVGGTGSKVDPKPDFSTSGSATRPGGLSKTQSEAHLWTAGVKHGYNLFFYTPGPPEPERS